MNETTNIPEPSRPDDRGHLIGGQFKFRRVNEITGTFVLVVVAVLIAAVVWTGHSQRWFKSRVTLRIVLPEAGAAGIRQGSEVYFLGTLVGSVSYVEVDEKGRMEAEANIRRDFFRFVRADSSAVIKKKFGVAGDSFFEVTRGEGKPLPENNASIVCNEQFQSALEAAIEDIRRDFFRFVRADSSAVIKKKFGVAGDSFFEITRGEGQPLPEKNASIVCKEQYQSALEAAVEEVRGQTLAVLKKTSAGMDTWT
ncbi:MAG TPA: MlaD family protein, partial [Verrucomicrobiae bacterium]